MRAVIENFRGIEHADIDLTRLALVAGVNASGKSSIARAVAAAVTGEAVPFEGIKKSEAGMLVRASTGGSTVIVRTSEDDHTTIRYPQGKVKSEGRPPSATPFAAGLKSVLDMPQKEASAVLLEYLRALPTPQDLQDTLAKEGIPADTVTKIVATADQLGWDGAHAHARETGVKLKGQWEHIAGERYGPTKAESWLPSDWSTSLEGSSEESLTAAMTEAGEFLEAAIAANAVSADERARLAEQAGQIDAARKDAAQAEETRNDAESKVRGMQDEVSTLKAQLDELPSPEAETETVPCPHCSQPVVVTGKILRVPEGTVSKAENARRKTARDGAAEALSEALKRLGLVRTAAGNAANRQRDAERHIADCEKAAKSLSELPESDSDAEQINRARARVRDAEQRLRAFRAKSQADSKHRSVEWNKIVIDILAPDGLRLTRLRAALAAFNGDLDAYCQTAGWGRVEIGDDLTVSYGRRPWPLLSESERFRCRVTLQTAMAVRDSSDVIIVDAADILDRAGRNGLIKLLAATEKPALICMTMMEQGQVPNVAGKNLGVSYWLDGGVAAEL